MLCEIANFTWPHEPYKGLANYECDDRHLFAGRDEEIDTCAQLIANSQTKLLVLHGQTGCGKSSFLRAGLIPALEEYGVGYLFLRRPASGMPGRLDPSFIRCGDDPLARIAEEIFLFTEQPLVVPTATGPKQIDLDAARLGIEGLDAFIAECSDPHRLFTSLERLTDAIPHTLVIILDQVEEIITLNGADKRNSSRFARFIKYLATSDIDMRFLLAIRKDHSGQFIESIQIGSEMSAAFRTFFLSDLSRDGIKAAILRPTLRTLPKDSTLPGPCKVYGFEYAPGVVDRILNDLAALIPAGASLPVMQIVCRDLYDQVREQPAPRVIEMPLYQQGGIKGRVKRHVVQSLREVLDTHKGRRSTDLDAAGLKWLRLLKRLVQEEGDGRVHTNVVPRETLVEWAAQERIDDNIDPIIHGLADPKVLVLRQFAVFAPGTSAEHELFCLGHDMVGIALRDALRNAEQSQHVSRLERKRLVQVACAFAIALASAGIIALYVMRNDAVRVQKVSALLAQSALSRNNDLLQSLAFAREAQRLVQGSLNEDERPNRAIANLLSGLPVQVSADRDPPPLAADGSIYPTYALNRRGGLAVLRSRGVLKAYVVVGRTVKTQTFDVPSPLIAVDGKLKLQSLQFSDVSSELLLGIYQPLQVGELGGIIAFPQSGTPRLFREDEVATVLGRQKGAIENPRLLGLSGDLIVLFSGGAEERSIRLATVRVTRSLGLTNVDLGGTELFPRSSQVNDKHIVSYFHPETEELVQGIPTQVVTRITAKNLATSKLQQWDVSKFSAVQKCISRSSPGQRCDVTAVPDMQQPGIVVLGLWEYSKGRYGAYPRGFISDLLVIDLDRAKATEVNLRAASAARQSCFAGGIVNVGSTGTAKDKDQLSDDDVPIFVMNGMGGLMFGYVSPAAAQMINVSSVPMTCHEVFNPGMTVDAWDATDDGGKLLGLTRDGGFVWNLQPSILAAGDTVANNLAQACANQLRHFVRRPGESAAKGAARQELFDRICR